jgi:uncharacterized protein YsxB (DUF464 family)
MIEIKFFRWKKLYFCVEVTGHSGRRRPGLFGGFRKDRVLQEGGEFGNIICAAVSALAFHLETGLMQVAKSKILRKEESTGYFYLELPRVPELKKVQDYFTSLLLTLNSLRVQYAKKLKISQEDVDVT